VLHGGLEAGVRRGDSPGADERDPH
jgi:hypothetical protein